MHSLTLDWVEIPSGLFLMGSTDDDELAWPEEHPQHTLDLPRFQITRTHITNAQFKPFLDEGGYRHAEFWSDEGWAWRNGAEADISMIEIEPVRDMYQRNFARRAEIGRDRPVFWDDARFADPALPVVGVSWHEASAYAAWANAQVDTQPGLMIRLPTEAEWEKAARGADGRIWSTGNTYVDPGVDNTDGDLPLPTPAGAYPQFASPYGVQDVMGNVWDWTTSRWGKTALKETDYPYPYDAADGREDPSGPYLRVLRGAGWTGKEFHMRCAHRGRHIPADGGHNIGFRLVMGPPLPSD